MTLTIAECGALWKEAVRLTNDSEAFRWGCAPTALSVYGTTGTQELANALDGSVDTVHNLAKAQRMYEYLHYGYPDVADWLRSNYGYVRFAAMWTKHEKYEIAPYDCIEFLKTDTSKDGMEALVEEIHNPIPEWRRRFENRPARKWLSKIATEPDADQHPSITWTARMLARALEMFGGNE